MPKPKYRKCDIFDCDRKHHAKGRCLQHYQKERKRSIKMKECSLKQIHALSLYKAGMTAPEVAECMGIGTTTLYRWIGECIWEDIPEIRFPMEKDLLRELQVWGGTPFQLTDLSMNEKMGVKRLCNRLKLLGYENIEVGRGNRRYWILRSPEERIWLRDASLL